LPFVRTPQICRPERSRGTCGCFSLKPPQTGAPHPGPQRASFAQWGGEAGGREGSAVAPPPYPRFCNTAGFFTIAHADFLARIRPGPRFGSPIFTYLSGVRSENQPGGGIAAHYRAGAVHLLGLVHGHWNLASEDRVDLVDDALDGGERVNMGIAIVVPITRVLEILSYPKLRAARENVVK